MRGISTRLKRLEKKREEEIGREMGERIGPWLALVMEEIPDPDLDLFLDWLLEAVGRVDRVCPPGVVAVMEQIEAIPGSVRLWNRAFDGLGFGTWNVGSVERIDL